MDIEIIWSNIVKNEDEAFYQIRGKEFRYSISANSIKLSTTNRAIPKTDVERAIKLFPLENTVPLQKDFQAPSYLYAILTDKRIV